MQNVTSVGFRQRSNSSIGVIKLGCIGSIAREVLFEFIVSTEVRLLEVYTVWHRTSGHRSWGRCSETSPATPVRRGF